MAAAASPAAASGAAATLIDTTDTTSAAKAWTQERETRIAESSRLRANVAELQQRVAGARKRATDSQATVDAARGERASLEQWFKRQAGTRTAAVEEARRLVREKMIGIARRAYDDRAAFGSDLDPAREQIAKLQAAAASAQRDVTVHATALEAYDGRSLRLGVLLLGMAAALLLALVVAPVVWRATRVVDPPPPAPLVN